MSNSDKNTLSFQRITGSDTISQFMEKVNNNFEKIIESNGGPAGVKGDDGDQGVPTKPKIPIHVWVEGENYAIENKLNEREYEVVHNEDLTNVKYQEGHLIMLQNAHLYKLENIDGNLTPKFMIALQSLDPNSITNGKNAYVHIAYADSSNGQIGFVTAQEVRGEFIEEQATTFGLNRNSNTTDISNKAYMGICSNDNQKSPSHYSAYTWVRIQGYAGANGTNGETGPQGPKGDKGDKGDGYTGHPFTVDLEGDMSTISVDINGCRRYEGDYCECILHGYYGSENVNLNEVCTKIRVNLPDEYDYSNNYNNNEKDIVHVNNRDISIGKIIITGHGNNIIIRLKPNENFVFPKKTIYFPIHIEASVSDKNDGKTYDFARDLVWMVKGIISTFELEIMPQYRAIKLFNDGQYYPENLLITVYKVEDAERDVFDFSQNTDFTLLYKNLDNKNWNIYPDEGVETKGVSCLEFKVVRYHKTENEEIWDYEDVWVVADGKSVHYYHADLGSAESMMVLTTGEVKNEGTEDEPIYCAELRNPEGYSITFEPKFYDGTTELEVTEVNIGSINGEEYTKVGSFDYTLGDLTEVEEVNGIKRYQITFKITKVPYNVDMIPMTFDVLAKCPSYDDFGNIVGEEYKNDTVSFNVYISTLSNLYTLVPTVSTYNTSTGKDGDTIGCSVYKNDVLIETKDLNQNALLLEYIVFDGGTEPKEPIAYSEPLIYGEDSDIDEDEFTAEDVAIVFILSYRGNEVARSTVPLIKDGIDGRDGDSWQYIFCRSPYYPFSETYISNPRLWKDNKPNDPDNELLGNNGIYGETELDWYDDHKGVDSKYRYEYQSYRKWDKDNKCWGTYGEPTLYSNYSESGSGYSVLLSNPVAVIPVGNNNWMVGDDNIDEIQYDSTLVYLYNNTSDISSHNNVKITLPKNYNKVEHFSVIKDNTTNNICKVIFKPVVDGKFFDFGSNTQYKLPITLTYNLGEDNDNDSYEDHFTSTINWTLSPIKGLEDFEVFVNKRVVNVSSSSKHNLSVGYYSISSNGGKKFIKNHNDEGNANNEFQIILTDDIGDLTDNIENIKYLSHVSNWENVSYNFVNNNGENRNCYVVLVGKDGKTIIDYAEVIPVTDGNDGKSAIHLELTQDYIALPSNPDGITTKNGAVHPDYDKAVQATMYLYDGITLISNIKKLITYSFKINGDENVNIEVNEKNGEFEIPKPLILGDTNLECIATYKGASYSKTIFIDLETTPYELDLNKSILTRDPNTNRITDTTLEVSVKYWMGGQWVYAKNGDVKITTPKGKEDIIIKPPTNNIDGKFTRTFNIQDSILINNTEDTEIRISYIGTSGKELSYEIIGIISNGKDGQKGEDGTAPSLVKTTILGYSLDENANEDESIDTIGGIYSDWVKSIDKLGTLEPGATIYILNEYTWSEGKPTRGITVTLAGTQGVDGKSRVLFYLGSYYEGAPDKPKTPTLKDSVKTTLNDVQCDYYIDSNGQAWMRTGKETDATLYPNSLDYHVYTIKDGPDISKNPYWVKSTPVGFLQAGAITADMINTGSITADSGLVTTLFAQEVTAEKLSVYAGNIVGTLTVGNTDKDKIKTSDIIKGINGPRSTNTTTIDGGKLTTGTVKADSLTAEAINSIKIKAEQITSGKINSERIDVDNLTVTKLNTNPIGNNNNIVIAGDSINIYDKDIQPLCLFSANSLGLNTSNAFKTASTNFKKIDIWNEDSDLAYNKSNFYNGYGYYTLDNFAISNEVSNEVYIGKLHYGKKLSFEIKVPTITDFSKMVKTSDEQAQILKKLYIKIIMKDENNTIIDTITYEQSYPNSSVCIGKSESKIWTSFYNAQFNYTIPQNSNTLKKDYEYYFKIGFTGHLSCWYNDGTTPRYLTGENREISEVVKDAVVYVYFSDTIKENSITMICNDGILINNQTNGMYIGDDGIVLKFDTYGIKIDKTGIKYSENLKENINNIDKATWKSLTSSTS